MHKGFTKYIFWNESLDDSASLNLSLGVGWRSSLPINIKILCWIISDILAYYDKSLETNLSEQCLSTIRYMNWHYIGQTSPKGKKVLWINQYLTITIEAKLCHMCMTYTECNNSDVC